ncbi:MAG: hypothetical protein A3F10_01935 [Coxiella sp. RIFCSPHIGHO2_12_FULL_42_15]|nr:MAG: hypothetical protein A3F10_01935 [Coxiella sp. RIFCSPHIGHO2_12_FULL_42_15]
MKKVLLIALFAATLGLMGCQKDESSSQSSTGAGDTQQGSQAQPSGGSSSQPSGDTSGSSGN